MEIINIEEKHYSEIAKIYLQGISTGFATFQTSVPSWEEWDKAHLKICRILAKKGNEIVGWAALTQVSSRCVYEGVAEVSIYIDQEFRGKGIGKFLLSSLIKQSEENGLWTLQSGIFAENIGSISLHEKCGFRKIGYREKIAKLNNVWKDNIIMERRSKTVGL
jgi:L-amino acid N-acyltransferase YncA